MFKNENAALQPSSFELHQWARHQRRLIMHDCIRSLRREFVAWLRELALQGAELARGVAVEARRRTAIRALHELDDRTLADIGVPRSGIETAVRGGWRMQARRQSQWPRASGQDPSRRQAA
jgi:uncharacterized protein YjiS (DUF1127 family)